MATCFSANVGHANPTGHTVVHGTATVQQLGNILNITNSPNAIINWGSFSIGVNELTRFIQQSSSSAVLNRVIGQDPSAILGALQSNGRVFLINPNGILFGAGSQINVAGLVASTLNLSDSDFLAGRMRFTDGVGAKKVEVESQASITAGVPDANGNITGGSVYLVGNAVTNNGLITSPGGEVVLAAGNSVELVNPGTPNLRVEIVAPDNEARNLGSITAEAGRIGIYAGLINNSGTLNASSAVSEGGKILLKAKKDIMLASTSVIDASGKDGGEIIAFADNNMYVNGTLKASAPVSGNGGFIETSGKNRVKIADSAIIDTTASQGIKGTWLIDPSDFVIAAGSSGDMSGSTLSSLLLSTDVVISTASYGGPNYYYGSGAYGGNNGDILVNDAVSWDSSNSLTLTAQRHVVVNQAITNLGDGNISLNAGWDGSTDPALPTLTNSGAAIMLNAPISTNGDVYLRAVSDITQNSSAPIMANKLLALSNSGIVNLANATNNVNTLAGSAIGSFAFKNSGNLTIGTVGSVSGINVNGANPGNHASIDVNVTGGHLTINRQVSAQGAHAGGSVPANGGNATIALSATNGITVDSSDFTAVEALGGNGAYGGAGGAASIQLTAGSGAINIDGGEMYAGGGQGGYIAGTYGLGGEAKIKIQAGNGIAVEGGEGCCTSIQASGGYGSTGGTATVELINTGASASVQILNNADVGAQGGDGSEGGAGGNSLVMVSSAGGITVSDSMLFANGGSAYAYGGNTVGGAAGITMQAGGNIQIEGAEGVASGGSGTTGGNAAINVIAGGNITVDSFYYYGLQASSNGNTPGVASVVLAAAGNVSLINGAKINTSGVAGLGGANILLDGGAFVSGNTGVVVSATGNLDLMNGSYLSSGSNAYITTGGNVTVDSSSIFGSQEVLMNVGGAIKMNNFGTISAASPQTIFLTFPMLTSGGYFVNGVEGVVYDSGTGFVVFGDPAILGTNLHVIYGGGTALNIPTDALIVAMGESSKPPDPEKDKNVFEDIEEGKKKDAPVCR